MINLAYYFVGAHVIIFLMLKIILLFFVFNSFAQLPEQQAVDDPVLLNLRNKHADKIQGAQFASKVYVLLRKELETFSPTRPAQQNCFVFKSFVALEIDQHEKGASELIIRKRSLNQSPQQLCSLKITQNDQKIESGNYIKMALDNYILTEGDDSFGNIEFLGINDSVTGKRAHSFYYNYTEPVIFKKVGTSYSVEYYQLLDQKCDLAINGKICWKEILKQNQIPIDLRPPVCPPSKVNDTVQVQIFAKVKIENISRPERVFIQAPVQCFLNP